MTDRRFILSALLAIALAASGCLSISDSADPDGDASRQTGDDETPGQPDLGEGQSEDPNPGNGSDDGQGSGPGAGGNDTSQYGEDLNLELIEGPESFQQGSSGSWKLRVEHRGGADSGSFLYSSICIPPWVFTVHDADGNEVDVSGPLVYCMAYGEAELEPGESLETEWSWDGTRWDDGSESFVPVEAGTYTLTVLFERVDERGTGVSLSFDLHVESA